MSNNYREFKRNILVSKIAICLGITLVFYGALRHWGEEKQNQTVTLYAYSDMLSPEVFEPFEEKTGIHVNVRYFEAVEELMTKLVFAHEEDVDLIAPTDSMVEILIASGLLRKLDKSKVPSFRLIHKKLLGQFYDRGNNYAVPFSWSPIGIGYNRSIIDCSPDQVGWDLIFGKKRAGELVSPGPYLGIPDYTVCLGEDPWETIFLASLYLYGSIEGITQRKQDEIVALLRRQKLWLECYTNNLKYFLVSGVSPAVIIPGAYMSEIMEEHEECDFSVPSEGGLLIIGELAIPKISKHPDRAYQVINYLNSLEGSKKCFEEHLYNPANKQAGKEIPQRVRNHPSLYPRGERFEKLAVAHNKIPLKSVERMWHQIKL